MRVLLLNPPGEQTYIRDYLCSKTTKSNYLYHPIDLVMLSGTLASEHDVSVLDAMAEGLSVEHARERIAELDPEVIVSLVASVSWAEDRRFLSQLARPDASGPDRIARRVVGLGDVLHEESVARLAEEPWLEAALHVFVNRDILHYLAGERDRIEDMTVRDARGRPERLQRLAPRHRRGEIHVDRPRHELFERGAYRFSFARNKRFATVLSDYGCPYPCTFCVMSTLGFQTRTVHSVLEEIDSLRARGTREIFFLDQTFGVKRSRALELCDAFAERGDLSWTAFSRPDTIDDELLSAMKRGGCHTLILGVESSDDELLEVYRKGYDTRGIREGFRRAKRHGLRTVGTFVIGLPEQDEASLERSLQFAEALDLDFLSLNVAVPRFGTPFRRRVLELGLAQPEELVMDQGGAEAFLPTLHLDRRRILELKRRLVRRFYLRPGYLLDRLRSAASVRELAGQAQEGLALLRRNLSW